MMFYFHTTLSRRYVEEQEVLNKFFVYFVSWIRNYQTKYEGTGISGTLILATSRTLIGCHI